MTESIRAAVAEAVDSIASLTPGRTGNLSVRDGQRVAITPTGVPYPDIVSEDVPVLDLQGDQVAGDLEPSSEVPMHLGIYRAMEVGAIVHVHAPWTTTLAVLREPLPAVHYSIAQAGREVPVAGYAPFGTKELAENAVSAMTDAGSTACILANHGLIAAGSDLESAMETTRSVESVARVYLQARSVGEPVTLGAAAMAEVEKRFETYGQRADGE